MNLLREMSRYKMQTPRTSRREAVEAPKKEYITVWRFRKGRYPELTRVEKSEEGYLKAIRADDFEEITLSCGLGIIYDSDNVESEYTFEVGDWRISGDVLITGADENGICEIPREAFDLGWVLEMCSLG